MSTEVKEKIEFKIVQSLPRSSLNKLGAEPKQMQPAQQQISTCPNCAGVIEETSGGEVGCMFCLLQAGIGSEKEVAQDSTPDAFEGGVRFGLYEIDCHADGSLCELGRGAMGVTYRATDTSLQRKVALKIIRTCTSAQSTKTQECFLREAREAAALRHENIATVFQFGIREETGQCFYAMELIEGETLEERIRRSGPIDVLTTIDIAQQVAAALAAAEKRGLMRCDLKPASLMLADADEPQAIRTAQRAVPRVKIIDFGLAKALNAQADPMSLTRDQFVGTPEFASPEQFVNAPLDVRSDIYSLGVTLWFALTGKTPFAGGKIDEVHRAKLSNKLPVEQLNGGNVPPRLRSLLESMLAPEPAARPAVQDLAAQLRRCAAATRGVRQTRGTFAEPDTAAREEEELHLEIAHVLFIDVVGYSKLLVGEQREVVAELNQIVRKTNQFHKSETEGKLIRLPSGDGMALVFFQTLEEPIHCALEVARALKNHARIRVRMGVHSGPVDQVKDVNDRIIVAGAGINMAERVMGCGDAGHILLSKRVADDLGQERNWHPLLHDLGEMEVKHGVRLGIVNLYTEELGNSEVPQKFKSSSRAGLLSATAKTRTEPMWTLIGAAVLILVAITFDSNLLWQQQKTKTAAATSGAPEKSIAVLPFENLSKEAENAFFADGVHDEILTELSRIPDLKVVSRTSVMHFKSGAARNLREIGRQLGVANVVEGSVQRAGNRVRVNAQLVDARTDRHLWAQTYDRDLADVFAIQSEIAKTIADQLQAKLSPHEEAAIEQAPTADAGQDGG
jgi:TolB-like protein/serine/threonine protein kinase